MLHILNIVHIANVQIVWRPEFRCWDPISGCTHTEHWQCHQCQCQPHIYKQIDSNFKLFVFVFQFNWFPQYSLTIFLFVVKLHSICLTLFTYAGKIHRAFLDTCWSEYPLEKWHQLTLSLFLRKSVSVSNYRHANWTRCLELPNIVDNYKINRGNSFV